MAHQYRLLVTWSESSVCDFVYVYEQEAFPGKLVTVTRKFTLTISVIQDLLYNNML